MKKSYTQFIEELHNAHPNITPISEYNGYHNPIDFECTICGYKWYTSEARSGIRHNCKKCSDKIRIANSAKARAKTEEQFRKELAAKQPNLIPNDKYINNGTKYHCICKIHNIDVYKTPKNIYSGIKDVIYVLLKEAKTLFDIQMNLTLNF